MQLICIDKSLLGTKQHLLSLRDGTYKWLDTVPSDSWYLSGSLKSKNCLDSLFVLNDVSLKQPPQQFVDMMNLCMPESEVIPPWQKIMPKLAHQTFMREIISQAEESIDKLSLTYYEGAWSAGSAVLSSLTSAHIDVGSWIKLVDQQVGNWRVVNTFQPIKNNKCSSTNYNRFGTRTGRLTVESGPDILTLKRDYRNILRSQYGENGKIVYLDFSNLEARILLYESGGRCDDIDLYSFINNELFSGTVCREDVKSAVISELYGQGKWALGKKLNLKGKELNHFVTSVKNYFKTSKLLKRVKDEFIKKGYITNRYGRRLKINEPLDNIFINTYTQSTGVDVTMLGFNQIITATKQYRINPIFLLHDAILFDCHIDDINHLKEIDVLSIKGYVQKFPISFNFI